MKLSPFAVLSRLVAFSVVASLCSDSLISAAPLESIDVSGAEGHDGSSGKKGADGNSGADGFLGGDGSDGGNGKDGSDATEASRGGDAGSILFDITPVELLNGRIVFSTTIHQSGSPRATTRSESLEYGESGRIILQANGGRGGDGGTGGDGGDGGNGGNGGSATKDKGGGNGGNGGQGGDGGRGTSGRDGGDGGSIRVRVKPSNTHLLMLFQKSVSAGEGGRPGQNGRGGDGGSAGSGGSSHSWTTDEPDGTNEDGTTKYKSVTHSQPSGSDGSSGARGSTPRSGLSGGADGKPGSFAIELVAETGTLLATYLDRYDLKLEGYDLEVGQDHGLFEPGDRVFITHIRVRNSGKMPTPEKVKARFSLPSAGWMISDDTPLELPKVIKPNESIELVGSLSFVLNLNNFHLKPDSRFEASQSLSPRADLPVVNRPFDGFNLSKSIRIQMPLQIEPAEGLVSLGRGETSMFAWRLTNISNKAFGSEAELKRLIQVRLSVGHDSEVDSKHIRFYDSTGKERKIDDAIIEKLSGLEAGKSTFLVGALGFDESIDLHLHSRAVLIAEIQGGAIADGRIAQTMETRTWEVTVAEPFQIREAGTKKRVLLVSNHETTREEIETWKSMLEQMGFEASIWSVSYYGFLDFAQEVNGNPEIFKAFEGQTVVILDNGFSDEAHTKRMTHHYLQRDQVLRALVDKGMSIYIPVASQDAGELVASYLTPTTTRKIQFSGETHGFKTTQDFLADLLRQRDLNQQGFMALTDQGPSTDFNWHTADFAQFHIPIQLSAQRLFGRAVRNERQLATEAKRLQTKLHELYPHRRYQVVYDSQPERTSDRSLLGISRRWKLGTLQVLRGPDSTNGNLVALSTSNAQIHDPEFITGQLNYFGFVTALTFDQKLSLLDRHVSGFLQILSDEMQTKPTERLKSFEELTQILLDAILVDLAVEQHNARSTFWNAGVDQGGILKMLQHLEQLSNLEWFGKSGNSAEAVSNHLNAYNKMFVKFLADIEALVRFQTPWWEFPLPGTRGKAVRAASLELHKQAKLNLLPMVTDRQTESSVKTVTADSVFSEKVKASVAALKAAKKARGLKINRRDFALAHTTETNLAREDLASSVEYSTDPAARVAPAKEFARRISASAKLEAERVKIAEAKLTANLSLKVQPAEIPTKVRCLDWIKSILLAGP